MKRVKLVATAGSGILILVVMASCGTGKRLLLFPEGDQGSKLPREDLNGGAEDYSAPDAWTAPEIQVEDLRVDVPKPADGMAELGPDGLDHDFQPFPYPCCYGDDDCATDEVCVWTPPIFEGPGSCHPKPGAGECYNDIDCSDGMHCEGACICPCDMLCECKGPGICVPTLVPGCCKSDEECPGNMKCIGADLGAGGVCFGPLPPGECFYKEDCPDGYFCASALLCSCDMDCLSQPGKCTPLGKNCCFSDADCEPGMVCAGPSPQGIPGVCEPPPMIPGMCWNDWDCEDWETCKGEQICPCDAVCDQLDQPGVCVSFKGECCLTDDECPPGRVCVMGNCEPAPKPGECFKDSDCYETQTCKGAIICPCGAICLIETMPGKCWPLPSGCCYDNSDCPDDTLCKGGSPDSGLPGHCLVNFKVSMDCPPPGGCCWDDADCPPGETCDGAILWGCIELSDCETCPEDYNGFCQ